MKDKQTKKKRESVWQWEKDISNNLWDKDEKTKECLQKKDQC